MPCSGSSTSPVPVTTSDAVRSATASIASSRRRTRSERQSFASSTAARVRWPWCFSSFASKRSNSVNASAVAPANPASTLVVVEAAHLARRRLDDDLSERDLAVAAQRDRAVAADGRGSWSRETSPCAGTRGRDRWNGPAQLASGSVRLLDEMPRRNADQQQQRADDRRGADELHGLALALDRG